MRNIPSLSRATYDGEADPDLEKAWQDFDLAGALSDAFGVPVKVANDADVQGCAVVEGKGFEFVMTLGTGVGGGLAIHGALYLGLDGAAGEIGHQTIDPDGPLCNCGNRGCVEAFARADVIAATCGTTTVEEAVHAAAAGDVRALDGLAQVGRYLGIGIANIVTVLTPDRVVLGGGVAAAGHQDPADPGHTQMLQPFADGTPALTDASRAEPPSSPVIANSSWPVSPSDSRLSAGRY